MNSDSSVLDVVILVVLAQGMSVWWGAETPYSGALEMSPDGLKKFEWVSSAATVTFGFAAMLLTRKVSPLVFSILFSVAMVALYDWEYKKAKGEINHGRGYAEGH